MISEISFDALDRISKGIDFEPFLSNALFCKLYSNAQCLCPHSVCNLYTLSDRKGGYGFLLKYASSAVIFCTRKANLKELLNFLKFEKSIKFIEAQKNVCKKLGNKLGARTLYGNIMRKMTIGTEAPVTEVFNAESPAEFFNFLKKNDAGYKNIDYDFFYCDTFYRKSLPCVLKVARDDGKCIATAGIFHRNDRISIISDVNVHKNYRRRKIATSLISVLCSEIEKYEQTPVVFCINKQAYKLYSKLGFYTTDKFGVMLFK